MTTGRSTTIAAVACTIAVLVLNLVLLLQIAGILL
jgi:hypothetical protein